jgi:dTDP-glucose 4,6-dehydratase
MLSEYSLPVNIGNPAEMTVLDFAREIVGATGSRSRIVFKPLPQDDPKQRRPDITLARKILAWEPKVRLAEGLVKTIDYFKKKS